MKSVFVVACTVLFAMLQTPALLANGLKEHRVEADQHYLERNFQKAYKIYYKLAKTGDHYSQDRISQMYAKGEGKTTDLTEAYAWSVLAAESGDEKLVNNSDELLQRINDQTRAQRKATKLKKKYGEQALKAKQASKEKLRLNTKSGGCTGSKLGCR